VSVQRFERAFAAYVGAEYCIALCNGTATLHTALLALGVQSGDRVAVPPLTMSATTIAVLQVGAVPVFCDVDPKTWLVVTGTKLPNVGAYVGVSLYGLHFPAMGPAWIDDAAQTLKPHGDNEALSGFTGTAFTSYSFQSSKILSCGEGGALCTNDPHLAKEAREISSLGYQLAADQPRIDSSIVRNPTYQRHHRAVSYNYRLAPLLAEHLLSQDWDALKETRQRCAALYRQAIKGCDWLTPQYVPEGWTSDYWTYAVRLGTDLRISHTPFEARYSPTWEELASAIVKHGGERPYAAWRLTYQEPAFAHLASSCPIAESLQPRLMQFATNNLASAMTNARALSRAIENLS